MPHLERNAMRSGRVARQRETARINEEESHLLFCSNIEKRNEPIANLRAIF